MSKFLTYYFAGAIGCGFDSYQLRPDDRRHAYLYDQGLSEFRGNEEELWFPSTFHNRSVFGLGNASRAIWWEWPLHYSKSTRSSYTIQGQTQDGGGAPLGNVTVRAYLTADDTLQGQCTSNAGGWYYIGVPTNAAHYLIMTKSGSPARGGMSPNNVIPT